MGLNHYTPFGQCQQLCELLSISNVRCYRLETNFCNMCTVTLSLTNHWIKFVWNRVQIKHWSFEFFPGYRFWLRVYCGIELDIVKMILGCCQGISLGHGQQLFEIYPDPTTKYWVLARTWILAMLALWPWWSWKRLPPWPLIRYQFQYHIYITWTDFGETW